MKHRSNARPLISATCVSAIFLPTLTLAQQASDNLEEVIVTGTARSEGLRKLDASFSITTATAEQIEELAPKSTAELLRVVPGLWAEPTGGVSGANIDIRGFPGGGDAPFVTVQLEGSPLFSPPTLSFLENSTLFRLDDTVERVEVLRGGPSPIFANGQPGVTVNFIQKKGTDTPEGIFRGTVGSEGLYRGDVFYGGKIAEGWYFTAGGFYRESEGVRETEFPADRGAQVSGTLTRKFDAGEVTFYARQTRDRNAFFTGTPLRSRNNGRDISRYPGFDPGEDTFYSEELQQFTIETGAGASPQTRTLDLEDGRNIDLTVAGLTVDLEFGDWTLTDRANFVTGEADTIAIFTGANPTTIGGFINASRTTANTTPAIVASAGLAASGSASFVNGGAAITDPNVPVIVVGRWSVDKDIDSFTNDLRLSREIFDGNTLTVGAYFADYSTDDSWFLGNNSLITLEPNARLINVALSNGVAVTRQGFTGATTNQVNAHYEATNIAGFIADEWEITDRLRLDAGVRYEEYSVDGRVQNTLPNVDLDANPRTLYNNAAVVLAPTARDIDFDGDEISWTAGLNFYLTDSLSTFLRVNSGFKFPQFDNLRTNQRITQKIDQYEVGLKTETDVVSAYATFFFNDFEGLPFQQFVETNGQLVQVTGVAGSRAYGVELETTVRPIDNLSIQFLGNWVDAEVKDILTPTDPLLRSGNQIQRQPRLQFRITPEYEVPLPWGSLDFFVTYTHVGERFSDIQNQQRLPEYDTFDAGVRAEVGDHLTLQLTGTNLTDELGLTEGNARIIGAGNEGGVFLGRTIFGPTYSLSAAYKL